MDELPPTAVTRWRFGDAAARLLNGRAYSSPPDNWATWKEPSPALPIDDLIADLIRRNKEPRLLSRSELKERQGVVCPYYIARFAVAAAVDAATTAAAEDPAEMAKRWRIHEKAARQAITAIAAIDETLLSASRPAPRLPFVETPELVAAYKTVLLLRRMDSFDRIADEAQKWRRFYQQARGKPFDVWRAVFAAELGFAWAALTGALPSRNEDFTYFVAAAYASIDDELSEFSWERAIRRVVKLSLDWRGRGMSFAETQKIFSS